MKEFSKFKCMLVKEETVPYEVPEKVSHPEDVFAAIKAMGYCMYPEEVLGVFTFDSHGRIIGFHEVSHGTINSSLAIPRDIFKRAILDNAISIILFHNHPSGVLDVSDEDMKVTREMIKSGNILGIKVQDHLIVGDNEYVSVRNIAPDTFV